MKTDSTARAGYPDPGLRGFRKPRTRFRKPVTRFQSYKRFAETPPQAMPRPKVWGDFTEDASFEGEDDAGDDLVEFTCPYNCGKPIRMPPNEFITALPVLGDYGRICLLLLC